MLTLNLNTFYYLTTYVMKAYLTLGALAALTLASCSGGKKAEPATNPDATAGVSTNDRTETYTGTLPAADVEGIRYTLTLQYDDDGNDGDYSLEQVYISDTDPATFTSNGDFDVKTGTPQSSSQRYVRLVSTPDLESAPRDTMYFVITSDSTLMLTGPDLTPAVSGLNYTITRTK